MNTTPLVNRDREERLDEVLGAYLEAAELGRAPGRTEFLAAYPDLADDLAAFLDDRRLGELPSLQPIRKEILEAGLRDYQEFLARHADDPSLREEMALTHFRIGLQANVVGPKSEAINHYRTAIALFEELLRQQPGRRDWSGDRASALINLANLLHGRGDNREALGNQYHVSGQQERGLLLVQRARRLLEGLVQTNPDATDFQHDLAAVCTDLGRLRLSANEPGEGRQFYERAIDLNRQLLAAHPDEQPWRLGLAQAEHNLGNLYLAAGFPCEAADCYHEARRAYEVLLRVELERVLYHHQLGGSLNNMGDAVQRLGQANEAVTLFEQAVAHQRRAFEREPSAGHRAALSSHLHNLARAHRLAKRPEAAVALSLERRKLWLGQPDQLLGVVREFLLAAQLVAESSPAHARYIDHALETVGMAVKAGYRDRDHLRRHPDYTKLRQRPEFEKLLQTNGP